MEVLERVTGINFSRFSERDVVRHPLVQSIIHAYRLYRDEPTGANQG
jgi:phosphate starvation-inducible PhoH-like protein